MTMTTTDAAPRTEAFDLAKQIATSLAPAPGCAPWVAKRQFNGDSETVPEYALLERADGATICLHLGGYRNEGRIQVSGRWPKFSDGRVYTASTDERGSISCDAGRAPGVLAREIERRLLGVYLPAYAKAKAYVDANDQASSQARLCAERLAAKFGGTTRTGYRESLVWTTGLGVRGLKVTPDAEGGPRVSLDLSTDEATVTKILELLENSGKGDA